MKLKSKEKFKEIPKNKNEIKIKGKV